MSETRDERRIRNGTDRSDPGWVGVDFDGTLSTYKSGHGYSPEANGAPIRTIVERIKRIIAQGIEVRVVTARATDSGSVKRVKAWCLKVLGKELAVTNKKDYMMIELWDDRAVQVITNTGEIVEESLEELRSAVRQIQKDLKAIQDMAAAARPEITKPKEYAAFSRLEYSAKKVLQLLPPEPYEDIKEIEDESPQEG